MLLNCQVEDTKLHNVRINLGLVLSLGTAPGQMVESLGFVSLTPPSNPYHLPSLWLCPHLPSAVAEGTRPGELDSGQNGAEHVTVLLMDL